MASRTCLQRFQVGNSFVELRLTNCGKKNCGKCPHGPYWYQLFTTHQGRQVKKYIGKELPAKLAEQIKKGIGSREVSTREPMFKA